MIPAVLERLGLAPHLRRQNALTPDCTAIAREPIRGANAVTFIVWAAIVATLSFRHQVWRDEMRALSLALSGDTLPQMFATLHGEGHPLVWYLILRLAYFAFHTAVVLKLAAFAIAAAAASLFLYRSPFPYVLRALFLFSPLMLFEYSVLSRNYGISIVFMFLVAMSLSAGVKRPMLIGALLFLLANTNAHSVVFAAGYMVVLLGDWLVGPRRAGNFGRMVAIPGAFAVAGAVVCFLTVWPAANDLAAHAFVHDTPLRSLLGALISPGSFFEDVLPSGFLASQGIPFDGLVGTIILYAMVFGLARHPARLVAGLLGIFGLALLFSYVYPGSARHEGLIIPYILSLYWIGLGRGEVGADALLRGISLGYLIPIALFLTICIGAPFLVRQLDTPYSMSGRVGALLNGDPALKDAIVISDLDYNLEPLPYYCGNTTYLVRESRYGKVPIFTERAKLDLSLSNLLATAHQLKSDSGRPVVILVTADLAETGSETVTRTVYGWLFRYDDAQVRAFREATREVASLRGAETENYDVYLLN